MKTLDTSINENKPPDELDESPFKKTEKRNNANENKLKLPTQCCPNCFCDCKAKYGAKYQSEQADKENANESTKQQVYAPNAKNCKKCKYVKPRSCMISGGVELVPLLARRRAMQRPISLSTTDVTKYPVEKK